MAARRIGLAPVAPPGSLTGAPGDGSANLDRRYVPLTGTSVAAAHVAGAVVLMQQAAVRATGCYLSTTQIRDIQRTTATPMPGYPRWQVGAGMVDVTAAVRAATATPTAPSPDPWICPPRPAP